MTLTEIFVDELPNGLWEVSTYGRTTRVIRATTSVQAVEKFLEGRE